MIKNLPDNVTGRELAIAGPDWDGDFIAACPNDECNFEGTMPAFVYAKILTILCPKCDREWSEQL